MFYLTRRLTIKSQSAVRTTTNHYITIIWVHIYACVCVFVCIHVLEPLMYYNILNSLRKQLVTCIGLNKFIKYNQNGSLTNKPTTKVNKQYQV